MKKVVLSVVAALAQSCEALGLSYSRMVSRAYHDSLFMSRIAPMASFTSVAVPTTSTRAASSACTPERNSR